MNKRIPVVGDRIMMACWQKFYTVKSIGLSGYGTMSVVFEGYPRGYYSLRNDWVFENPPTPTPTDEEERVRIAAEYHSASTQAAILRKDGEKLGLQFRKDGSVTYTVSKTTRY